MKFVRFASVAALLMGTALAETPPTPPPPVATPSGPAAPSVPDPNDKTQPAGMIRDLYTRYFDYTMAGRDKPDAAQDPTFDWNTIADGYFDPALATRFKKALADKDNAIFDWDFFINGQDFDKLAVISVAATSADGAKAVVRVVTSNTGVESTTDIEMAKQAAGWRITDFVWNPDSGADKLRMTDVLKEAGY